MNGQTSLKILMASYEKRMPVVQLPSPTEFAEFLDAHEPVAYSAAQIQKRHTSPGFFEKMKAMLAEPGC